MRTIVILAVVFAAAAAVWLLLAPGAEEGTTTTGDGSRAPREPVEEVVPPSPTAVRIEVPPAVPRAGSLGSANAPSAPPPSDGTPRTTTEPAPPAPPMSYVPPEPPERLPKGRLRVTPRDPEDALYPSDAVRVTLEPVAGTYWTVPTGMPDAATGVWTFDPLPVGRVRVTVGGDHVIETNLDVDVVADRDTEAVVRAPHAGALAYRVLLGSGEEMPPQVSLALLRGDKPVKAFWQVRTPRVHTTPRSAPRITQGPEGIVFGVKPGAYKLEVVGPSGTKRVVDVEIVAGRTASLDVRLS